MAAEVAQSRDSEMCSPGVKSRLLKRANRIEEIVTVNRTTSIQHPLTLAIRENENKTICAATYCLCCTAERIFH